MKFLACREIDSSSIDNFVAKGMDEEETIKKMIEHFKDKHSEKVEEMSKVMTEKEMMELMKLKIAKNI
jgi:hypothetical protein